MFSSIRDHRRRKENTKPFTKHTFTCGQHRHLESRHATPPLASPWTGSNRQYQSLTLIEISSSEAAGGPGRGRPSAGWQLCIPPTIFLSIPGSLISTWDWRGDRMLPWVGWADQRNKISLLCLLHELWSLLLILPVWSLILGTYTTDKVASCEIWWTKNPMSHKPQASLKSSADKGCIPRALLAFSIITAHCYNHQPV